MAKITDCFTLVALVFAFFVCLLEFSGRWNIYFDYSSIFLLNMIINLYFSWLEKCLSSFLNSVNYRKICINLSFNCWVENVVQILSKFLNIVADKYRCKFWFHWVGVKHNLPKKFEFTSTQYIMTKSCKF